MKLRLFFLSIVLFFSFTNNICFSQNIIIGEGPKDASQRKHLKYESNKGDSILYYKGYSVIFSYTYNLPLYTFNLLTIDNLLTDIDRPPVKRSSTYFTTRLPNGTLSATNVDFKYSGYDRGHMVPAGDFVWNKELKDETFFYTNINPQSPNLNRGLWANLENQIRTQVLRYSVDVYVVTGVLFNPAHKVQIGPNQLCIPVSFFKIVFFDECNVMYAFLFDNTIDTFYGDISDFQVSVDFLEQITGEDFFDLLDDHIEQEMESAIVRFND
ncbi:MAG: DNA/RNA non-specific endonuclease [Candidatus Izemoplasmatales bacterium]|nr:DNA/RNA non-specific endonuclease [Candidatus Izemoplasmatales bacterium]